MSHDPHVKLSAFIGALALTLSAQVSVAELPEVMLVIDASSSMQFRPGVDRLPTDCSWPRGGAPQALISAEDPSPGLPLNTLTRFHLVQDILAGSPQGQRSCLAHSATERQQRYVMGEDASFPHFRRACRSADQSVVPCGLDHGGRRGAADPDNTFGKSPLINEDGFIADAHSNVRFGLMVSDSNPDLATRPQERLSRRDWSYGDERLFAPPAPVAAGNGNNGNGNGNGNGNNNNNTPRNVHAPTSLALSGWSLGVTSPTEAPWVNGAAFGAPSVGQSYLLGFSNRQINLGVQGEEAEAGRLIHPEIGTSASPSLLIGDDAQRVKRHNDWVREELRRVVPTGPSPLSAMLSDLKAYYAERPAACDQTRVAVLVTDGAESTYMPLQECQNNRDCTLGGFQGSCEQTKQALSLHHERLIEETGNCAQQSCSKVCVYPDGAPYQSSVELARSLHDDLNVPVIVATVGLGDVPNDPRLMPPALQHAYKIAEAGSPGLGPRAGLPGIYTLEDLQNKLTAEQLIQRVEAGRGRAVHVETQPLVMSVAESDALWGSNPDPDLRQWRLSGSAEAPSGDSRFYGELELNMMGCEGVRADQAGLKAMGRASLSERVSQQTRRAAYTLLRGTPTGVIDVTGGALFSADGTPNGQGYKPLLPSLSDAQATLVARQVGGYFGERGLTDTQQPERRGFGANLSGDLVALSPQPALDELPSELAPNLIISGADDGLIHVSRAFDGVALFSVVPQSSWASWNSSKRADPARADALLAAQPMIPCRLAEGGGRCPGYNDEAAHPLVVGATSRGGRELFGFEVGFSPADLREREPNLGRWPANAKMWSISSSSAGFGRLGLTTSRPALTYARVNGRLRSIAVVGCGDDTNAALALTKSPTRAGRCLLFLDAFTGELIHRLEGSAQAQFEYPVVGAPSVYPGGEAAAEQVYVGDKLGQLWRVDMSGDVPSAWTLSRMWPIGQQNAAGVGAIDNNAAAQLERGLGFSIIERPSLSRAPNNDLVVLFATSGQKVGALPEGVDEASAGYMVSMRERSGVDDQGRAYVIMSTNWVLDFAATEEATSAPKVKDGVVYLTTSRESAEQVCGRSVGLEGRLYGVHYTKRLGDRYTDPFGGRSLDVVPMLPRYSDTGERADNALSLVLPPGRTAHGFALVPTPSCSLGVATLTELVMNLVDEREEGAELRAQGLKVEYVRGLGAQVGAVGVAPAEGGAVVLEQLELGQSLQVKMSGQQMMSVGLAPAAEGAAQGVIFNPVAPFSSKVLYWGSVDGE